MTDQHVFVSGHESFIVKKADGSTVKPGDQVTDFRGAVWYFTGVAPGARKVWVRTDIRDHHGTREFYPGVFNLTVRKV